MWSGLGLWLVMHFHRAAGDLRFVGPVTAACVLEIFKLVSVDVEVVLVTCAFSAGWLERSLDVGLRCEVISYGACIRGVGHDQ